jgi:hypothetical protein
MNERIRQLAEQCESFGSWDDRTYSFDKEKFAELIVRECEKNLLASYDREYGLTESVTRMKEHFGVEE